ncbi:hypothetical protein EDD11_001524 [Mortierella claussenii]|nr:hypothetical protein EDD11_001524 [Mortierella claussenii]
MSPLMIAKRNRHHRQTRLRQAPIFSQLETAFKTQRPQAIWDAYYKLRTLGHHERILFHEVWRTLIVHFKEASTTRVRPSDHSYNKCTISENVGATSALTEGGYQGRSGSDDIWSARIVTVLNDKRSLHIDLSRSDWSDLLSALNRLGRYEESLKEFDQLPKESSPVDPILLNHAVRAWGGLGRLDRAVEMIQNMQLKYNFKVSEYTVGYLVQKYLIAGDISEAYGHWQDLINNKLLKNIDTVNGILRACVAIKATDFGKMVYNTISGLEVEPTAESLNLMLNLAVTSLTHREDRTDFLQSMHKQVTGESGVYGHSILHSILVQFCKEGDVEGAMTTHRLMSSYGMSPGIEEYNNILHCYARLDQLDNAVSWFQEMRRSGIRPDRASYVVLMHAYTRQRRPRHVELLFRQLLSDGIQPDLVLCNQLLLAYEQARINQRCLPLYKSMLEDRTIGVDQVSFACMFNAIFHNEKALLEGGEGRRGSGTTFDSSRFPDQLAEPIRSSSLVLSEQKNMTLKNEDAQEMEETSSPNTILPTLTDISRHYQFNDATSTTESLNQRTIFRDMIMVGIRPSQSLYSNILRAFLSQDDYAGTAVALRVLVEHYGLKPTPKMNAIVVSWALKELKRRGDDQENALTKTDLDQLVHRMGYSLGLVELMEKVVYMERGGQEDGKTADEVSLAAEPMFPSDTTVTTATTTTTTGSSRRSCTKENAMQDSSSDPIEQAKMEMGGDLLDLYAMSPIAGSSWSTTADDPLQLDLKDFDRWFRIYMNRTTRAQVLKNKAGMGLTSLSQKHT